MSLKRATPLKRSELKRGGPLKRKAPMNKVRSKPRPGRLKGPAMTALRRAAYDRDKGICRGCKTWVSWDACHLAHIRGKRNWGDNLDNVCIKHADCHLVLEHNPKSVPPKPDELKRKS